MKKAALYFLAAVVFTGCSKIPDDPVTPSEPQTAVKFTISNVVGDKPLVFETENYINANGDTFYVKEYAYYISNISFVREDGTEYKEPESYHLVNHRIDSSKNFTVKRVPEGNYTKIKFLIGVDSTRNVSGAQSGALAPEKGMFWNWETGYVMAKFEGVSPNRKVGIDPVGYHVGGFSGEYNALRWVTITLPAAIKAVEGNTSELHLRSDLAEWFKTPHKIVFNGFGIITFSGPHVSEIADNYADMFSVTEVHNN
jgi:hypothetical protein